MEDPTSTARGTYMRPLPGHTACPYPGHSTWRWRGHQWPRPPAPLRHPSAVARTAGHCTSGARAGAASSADRPPSLTRGRDPRSQTPRDTVTLHSQSSFSSHRAELSSDLRQAYPSRYYPPSHHTAAYKRHSSRTSPIQEFSLAVDWFFVVTQPFHLLVIHWWRAFFQWHLKYFSAAFWGFIMCICDYKEQAWLIKG